jgi:hypothetical protein
LLLLFVDREEVYSYRCFKNRRKPQDIAILFLDAQDTLPYTLAEKCSKAQKYAAEPM